MIAHIPSLIPSLIEGAGLGHQFLRHLQLTGLLLHIVDLAPFEVSIDPVKEAKALVKDFIKRFGWKGPVFKISAFVTKLWAPLSRG